MSSSPSVALWMTGWAVATSVALLTGQGAGLPASDDGSSSLDDSGISTAPEPEIDPAMENQRPPSTLMDPGTEQWLWGPYNGEQDCTDALNAKGEHTYGSSSFCGKGSDNKYYFWWAE